MVHSLHLTALWQKLRANGYPLSPATIAEIQQLLISKQCSPKEIHKYKDIYKEVHQYVVPLVATNKEEQTQLTQLIKQFYKEREIVENENTQSHEIPKKTWIEKYKNWIYALPIALSTIIVGLGINALRNQPADLEFSIRQIDPSSLESIIQNEPVKFKLEITPSKKAEINHKNYIIISGEDTIIVNRNFEFEKTFKKPNWQYLNVISKYNSKTIHVQPINVLTKKPLKATIKTNPKVTNNNIALGDTLEFTAIVSNYLNKKKLNYRWGTFDKEKNYSNIRIYESIDSLYTVVFEERGEYNVELYVFEYINPSRKEISSNQLEINVGKELNSKSQILSFKTYPAGIPKLLGFKPIFWNRWLFLPFIPLLFWLFNNWRIRNRSQLIERKNHYYAQLDTSHWDSRPIELEFDHKGELINFGNSLKESSLLMRQKSEWESKRINAGKTADKSAQNYGWFSPVFRKTKLVKDFIILIDSEFPDSHQTALFKVLTERLQSFQISLDVYYYSYYIDTLYDAENNKYATQKIIQNQPDAYLIIFGEAEALIDLNKLLLNRQSMDLFSRLTQKKAIVSPVAIKDWSAREAILKTAFVVVPADLEAFNLMLQALITDIPAEEEKLRQLINRQYTCIFYDFTELKELQAYLSQYDTKDTEKLLQWLCALAVYPKLNWSITVKLGAALSKAMKMDIDLLQYNTLLLMSRIKWLHDGLLKDNLRLQMLKKLSTKNEIIARQTIMQLLEEVSDKVGEKALANFEYQSQRAINGFFLDDLIVDGKKLAYETEKQSMRYWENHISDWPLEKYIGDKTNKNLMPIVNSRKISSFKEYFELKKIKYTQKVRCISSLIGSICFGFAIVFTPLYLHLSPQKMLPYNLHIDFGRYENMCFGTLDTMNISFIDQEGATKTVEILDRNLKINGIRADENLGVLKIEHENLLITDTISLKAEKEHQKIVDSLYVDIDNCFCPYKNLNTENKKEVYCLNLSGQKLDTIPVLNLFSNLKFLDLSSNQIQKIENLDQLKQLKILYLSKNQIQKIENLDQLMQLESLDLSYNQIQKIENLDQLKQLKILYLSKNQIQKIENLDQLKQLERLYLKSNQIQKIENLDQLKHLENLELSDNQIQKIENLDQLKQLESLYLSNSQIQKIENLDQLKQLENLYLSSNEIQKIENLDQLKQLEILDLPDNEIEKIENLSHLSPPNFNFYFKGIDLSYNPINAIDASGIPQNPKSLRFDSIPALQAVYDSLVNVVNESPTPELGLSKALISNPALLSNGTFNILLRFFVENSGNVTIDNLQITDDLVNTFSIAPTPNINIVNLINTSNNISGNTNFNGSTDINLLLGNDQISPGENGFVDIEVNFGPLSQNTNITFYNSAITLGYDPSFILVTDTSTNGLDPDPQNDGPNNYSEPTPIPTTASIGQIIGIAKELVGTSSILSDGTYNIVYKITIENIGPVISNNVQIIDNLSATFAGPPVVPINSVFLTGATNNITINPDFNGTSNNNLLTGTDSFSPGEVGTIRIEANVGMVPEPGGIFLNQAFVSAIDSDGSSISDGSQNGNNIDPDGDGPLNNNEPTPISLAPGFSDLNSTSCETPTNEELEAVIIFSVGETNGVRRPEKNYSVGPNLICSNSNAISYAWKVKIRGTSFEEITQKNTYGFEATDTSSILWQCRIKCSEDGEWSAWSEWQIEKNCNSDPCSGDVYKFNDIIQDCELIERQVVGCMKPFATNFNPNANCDDSSCSYDHYEAFADTVIEFISGCQHMQNVNLAIGKNDNLAVSIGIKGSLKLGFTGSFLSNSGDSRDDIQIFEAGSSIEEMGLGIKPADESTLNLLIHYQVRDVDDNGFFELGVIKGQADKIDIDSRIINSALVNPPLEAFSIKINEIELIDLTNGDCDNSFSGADIDAIKALFAIGKF